MLTRRAGEDAFLRAFHQSRLLCCDALERARGCVYEVRPQEDDASLFESARAHLADGRTCVTYRFLMTYASITAHVLALAASAAPDEATARAVPTWLVTSAALHTMREHNASFFRTEVDGFVNTIMCEPWARTAVVMHTAAATNATAIARGGFPQTEEAVAAFNAELQDALAAARAAGRERGGARVPSLVDWHAVTTDDGAVRRFQYLDEVHFRDSFYQTNFVVDALVLSAEACRRQVRANATAAWK